MVDTTIGRCTHVKVEKGKCDRVRKAKQTNDNGHVSSTILTAAMPPKTMDSTRLAVLGGCALEDDILL